MDHDHMLHAAKHEQQKKFFFPEQDMVKYQQWMCGMV
jgi:hypothetical protein